MRHKWLPDEILEKLFKRIECPRDRSCISEVCKQWYRVDGLTRASITVVFPYAVSPSVVTSRFQCLQGLRIKGEPRVSDFGLLGSSWGAYAKPWIDELVSGRTRGIHPFLKSLHLCRMKVSDTDLEVLAAGFGSTLEVLHLDKCTSFSTSGLYAVAHSCRQLRVFDLEESQVETAAASSAAAKDWIHELAIHNTRLEVFNFFLTGLMVQNMADIMLIVRSCKSLKCLKLSEIDVVEMRGILGASDSLRQLAVLYEFNDHTDVNRQLELPRTLTSFTGDIPLPLDELVGYNLVELDIMSTSTTLNADAHIEVISCCPNLETLKVRNVIGDSGLEAVAAHCRKLRRIRVENLEDHHGFVSHKGLVSLASSCLNLETVAIYVSDIANCALEAFGTFCPELLDFRLVLLDSSLPVTELPLDNGVKVLLEGCRKITRLAIYLRTGGLSDEGLGHIGRLGKRLKWMLLGYVGESDAGFRHIAAGCESLRKLEVRDCPFTDRGFAEGVRRMSSLRFLWIQGVKGDDLTSFLGMGDWRIEFIPGSVDHPSTSQIVAYRSVADYRADFPPEVVPLSEIAETLVLPL